MKCPKCKSEMYFDSDQYDDYPFRYSEWMACSNTDCDYSCNVPKEDIYEQEEE